MKFTTTKTAAVTTTTIPAADVVVSDTDDYQGMPTWSVGRPGGSPKSRLNHTFGKWATLWQSLPNGTPAVLDLWNALHAAAEDHQTAQSLVQGMDALVRQYLKWRTEAIGTLTGAIPEEMPETDPVDPMDTILDMVGRGEEWRPILTADIEFSGLEPQEWLQAFQEYGGSLEELLAESWDVGEDGLPVPADALSGHPALRRKAYEARVKAWEAFGKAEDQPEAPAPEPASSDAYLAQAEKLIRTQLSPKWVGKHVEDLTLDLAEVLAQGGDWAMYRQTVIRYQSANAYLASR